MAFRLNFCAGVAWSWPWRGCATVPRQRALCPCHANTLAPMPNNVPHEPSPATIRRYSAAEQRPCAIIQVLRAIVSNEENVISPIIIGNDSAPAVVRLLGRLRAFMLAIWLAARGVQQEYELAAPCACLFGCILAR